MTEEIPQSTRAYVEQSIKEAIGDDTLLIRESDFLMEDLGMDSMAIYEMVIEFEEHFNARIPDEDLNHLETVGDVLAYINKRQASGWAD